MMHRTVYSVLASVVLMTACSTGGSSGGVADSGVDGWGATGGTGATAGAGGIAGAAGAAGGGGAAATGGEAGAAGSGTGGLAGAGTGGAGGTGGKPQYNKCSNLDADCMEATECCVGDPAGGACVYTGFGSSCYPKCNSNDQCPSGCCGNGFCSWTIVWQEQFWTMCDSTTCSLTGQGCSNKPCCAGSACYLVTAGKAICASKCNSDADCPGGCCKALTTGTKVCVAGPQCLG